MSIRKPNGTIVHMPFPGHRTVAEVLEQHRIKSERLHQAQKLHQAREYGFGG